MKRITAVCAALALTAASVLWCCFSVMGLGQAAHAATVPSIAKLSHEHAMAGGATSDHCAEMAAPEAPENEHSGDTSPCGHCTDCSAMAATAPEFLAGRHGNPAPVDYAILAAAAHERPEFMPALLRATGPPQGPPVILRTPVELNTTLRL